MKVKAETVLSNATAERSTVKQEDLKLYWITQKKIFLKVIKKSIMRSSHRNYSVRKGFLKHFAKFTGKHLCQSLFFDKKDSGTGVFL